MGQMIQDSGWRIPDALWEQMVPLLPPRPHHPLGCHNPRVPDRAAMDAIFFVDLVRNPGMVPNETICGVRRWAATTRVSRIAPRSTRSSSSCAPAANGAH